MSPPARVDGFAPLSVYTIAGVSEDASCESASTRTRSVLSRVVPLGGSKTTSAPRASVASAHAHASASATRRRSAMV